MPREVTREDVRKVLFQLRTGEQLTVNAVLFGNTFQAWRHPAPYENRFIIEGSRQVELEEAVELAFGHLAVAEIMER